MATAAPAPPETEKGRMRDPYLMHKLHSASGIFPIGFFLVQHLVANSYALKGWGAYNDVISFYGHLPFVVFMELAIIYIPILFHAFYGFHIAAYGQSNVTSYGYGRNWMYFLQRVSGIVAFFYISYHVWQTSLHKYALQMQGDAHPERIIQYAQMAKNLQDPLTLLIYAVGIIATVFHFTNGIWNFCIRWGITISAKSQRLNQYFCWVLFFLFAGMGLASAWHLHTDTKAAARAGVVIG